MNRTKAWFDAPGGQRVAYQTWEDSHDSYRWIALVLHDPFVPVAEDQRLRDRLLSLHFKVYAPEFSELGATDNAEGSLDTFVTTLDAFVRDVQSREGGRAIVPLVFSVAALPFLYYLGHALPPVDVVALLSPVLDLAKTPMRRSFPLIGRRQHLEVGRDALSGDAESFDSVAGMVRSPRLPQRMVSALRREYAAFPGYSPLDTLDVTIGAFVGESDPLVDAERVQALSARLRQGTLATYTYPRGHHLILYDKHWRNTLDDLESFVNRYSGRLAS